VSLAASTSESSSKSNRSDNVALVSPEELPATRPARYTFGGGAAEDCSAERGWAGWSGEQEGAEVSEEVGETGAETKTESEGVGGM
jgi:hypothetical protein